MDIDVEVTNQIIQTFKGNPYAASMYVASQARKLLCLSDNALTESEAICWIMQGRSFDELKSYMKRHKSMLKEQKYNLINEYVSEIDDVELQNAFRNSAVQSNKAHRLVICYENLNYCQCTRLRILLKRYWFDHLQFEAQDHVFVHSR